MIRAVVLDLGSVLEIIDDEVFPSPFERRHGLEPGSVLRAAGALPGNPIVGEMSEAEVRRHWQTALGLSEELTDELVEDFWRWYVGTLDLPLFEWLAAQRPARRTAILSNSGPGARERERCWRLEDVTDLIVYSHEVGLAKPDPAVYELTTRRLGVHPHEVLFLDDVPGHVEAARQTGWHAVVHVDTPTSIETMEEIIQAQEDGDGDRG